MVQCSNVLLHRLNWRRSSLTSKLFVASCAGSFFLPNCMIIKNISDTIGGAGLRWKPRPAPNHAGTGKGFKMAESVLTELRADVCEDNGSFAKRSRATDLIGKKFGLLTVIGRAPNEIRCSGKKRSVWNCLCQCGGEKVVAAAHLRTGAVKSCGCLRSNAGRRRGDRREPGGGGRHGMAGSPEYRSWIGAKRRTMDVTDRSYHRYGGRGIQMSEEWREDFPQFLHDMGPRPHGTSLERRDNDGPYSRENCCWATPTEQAKNRRSSKFYRIGEREMSLTEWSKLSGIAEPRIWKRINLLGWAPERAVFEPIDQAKSSKSRRPSH